MTSPSKDTTIDNSELYFAILKIGVDHLETGLSFRELKSTLTGTHSDCESFIKAVFRTNFSAVGGEVGTSWGGELDENAKRTIKPGAVAEHLKLHHSRQNLESAKLARTISLWGLGVSLLAILVSLGILSTALINLSHSKQGPGEAGKTSQGTPDTSVSAQQVPRPESPDTHSAG